MHTPPLVSIIVPVYNGENFLAETLTSAIQSFHRPLEVIVVDDGSTDGSNHIAKASLSVSDVQSKVIVQKNEGEAAAVNLGASEMNGEFFMVLSADDLIEPDLITYALQVMALSPDIGVVYPDQKIIDEFGTITNMEEKSEYSIESLLGDLNCLPGVGTVVRSSVLGDDPPRDRRYSLISDYVLWLRLSQFTRFQRLPGFRGSWRRHSESTTSVMSMTTWNRQLVDSLEEFFADPGLSKEHALFKNRSLSKAYFTAVRGQTLPIKVAYTVRSLVRSPYLWWKLLLGSNLRQAGAL